MIDTTTVKTIIENLRRNGFTSAQEKLIAVILAHVPEIQQCELIEILELDKRHSIDTLRAFVETGLVATFGKRAIFYRSSATLTLPVATSSPPVSPRKTRKSPVNHVNSCKLTKPTNQEDSNSENQKTQATSIPSPEPTPGIMTGGILGGKAGSADVSLPKVETTSAPAAPIPSETPTQARKASRRNHLLINTAAERKANRTSRIAAEAVMSREYVNGTDNGYKVDTYWHPHDPDFPVTLRIPIIQPKQGTFLVCREMVRHLRQRSAPGNIVNISSQAALRGSQNGKTAYDYDESRYFGLHPVIGTRNGEGQYPCQCRSARTHVHGDPCKGYRCRSRTV